MKRIRLSGVIAAVGLALMLSANSYASVWKDGNSLHSNCGDEFAFAQGLCSGYIIGVLDANARNGFEPYCDPEGTTRGQMRDIVKKWLADNPAYRTIPADAAVTVAMMEAFPAKRKWRIPGYISGGEWVASKYSTAKVDHPDGKWVAACNSDEYKVDGVDIVIWGLLNLPENLQEALKTDRFSINSP